MSWERYVGYGALAVGVTIGARYATHASEVDRAFKAFFSLDPKCSEIMPSLKSNYNVFAIFGAGNFIDENGITQPNRYQVERVKMAAAAFVNGLGSQNTEFLFIDAGDGAALEKSIELLDKYISELSYGTKSLDRTKVASLIGSPNTAANVKDLKDYMLRT